MPKRDPFTLDMFTDWEPPEVAVGLPEAAARGGVLSSRIARAVSHALKATALSRDEVAQGMSEYLGESVTKNMLDAYASQARTDHRITLERFMALIEVTGKQGLIGFVAEEFGLIAVPARYRDLIELHFIEEQQKRLEQRKSASLARWRARK